MLDATILDRKWAQCLQYIANNVPPQHYTTWIVPMRCKSYDEVADEVVIELPSHFFFEYVEEHFVSVLGSALRRFFSPAVKLRYSVLQDKTNNQHLDYKSAPAAKVDKDVKVRTKDIQVVPEAIAGRTVALPELDSHLIPNLTFDSFVEGDSNKMPLAVARSIADNPDQQNFNPLFIYGRSGVGKTHLANAIGIRCKQLHPAKRVLYVSAHLFQVQYVDAQTRDNKLNDFIRFYQTIDVLIVDDVQEFQGMKGTLGTFFHIFNHLRMNGKQIILTCDRPTIELRDMEERMLTRFKWGLQCEIEQPTEQLRYNILKEKMRRDGLVISDDVVRYIAANVSDSVRDLEGIVNSLLAHSLCLAREIDVAMAEQVVRRAVRVTRQPVTIDRILQGVCDAFHVTSDDMQSSSRKAGVAHARQIAMYLTARMTDLSSTRIGMLMGKRSHATVLHSIRQAEARIMKDAQLREQVEDIRGALLSRI